MNIADVMTTDVKVASPADKVRDVARRMSEVDTDVIPIVEDGHIVGVETDRDIVIRVSAEDRDSEIPISEIMTAHVETCRSDDSVKSATKKMASLQMRRRIVVDDVGPLVGILSLGDVAREDSAKVVGHVLEEISE